MPAGARTNHPTVAVVDLGIYGICAEIPIRLGRYQKIGIATDLATIVIQDSEGRVALRCEIAGESEGNIRAPGDAAAARIVDRTIQEPGG